MKTRNMDWDENIYFSPCVAIYRFKDLFRRIGVNASFKKKKELEAYIAGITLLGVYYYENRHWWLQVSPQDPPDVVAATMSVNEENVGVLNLQLIEIFRIESYSKEAVWEAIKRKLRNKAYDQTTTLIGLINRDEKIKDFEYISKKISKINPRISSIWLVGNIDPQQKKYLVISVWPKVFGYTIDVDFECKRRSHLGHAIRVRRSIEEPSMSLLQITSDQKPRLIPNGEY